MTDIKEAVERLTDELLAEAEKAATTHGWAGQGAIPLHQAIQLVRSVRPEILSANEEGIIAAMPRQHAQLLRDRLNNLVAYAQNISNLSPQVVEFVAQAEALHLDLWSWGLRYKGKKLLGFDAKMAELTRLSDELARTMQVAADAATQRDAVEAIRAEADSLRLQIAAFQSESSLHAAEIAAKAEEAAAKKIEQDLQVAAIATRVEEATNSAASARARLADAQTSAEALETYYKKVEANEAKMNKAVADAAETVRRNDDESAANIKQNDEQTKALIARLEIIETEINQKLEKATGVTLFEAFGKRQEDIKKGLPVWLYSSGGVLLVSAGYSVWLLVSAGKIDTAFYVKLGFSLTFFAAITFTLRQYAKERRLEEEYAFKAAISVSLAAYRGLVEHSLEKLAPEERKEYATFLTKAVGTIFDPPTERVFGDRRSRGPTDAKVLAAVAETIKPITDLLRPVR
jgi:hypothetical protein